MHVENVGKEILKERGNIVRILRNWRIVFFSIAGISLLIGGVGIFSVLKISISERLFEIGLRKSIGAGDGEIFMQFLIESVTLSVVGAAIGLAGGIGVVKLIAGFFPAGLPGLALRPVGRQRLRHLDGIAGGPVPVDHRVAVAAGRSAAAHNVRMPSEQPLHLPGPRHLTSAATTC